MRPLRDQGGTRSRRGRRPFPFVALLRSIEYQLARMPSCRTRHDTFGVGNLAALKSVQRTPQEVNQRDRCGRLISETHEKSGVGISAGAFRPRANNNFNEQRVRPKTTGKRFPARVDHALSSSCNSLSSSEPANSEVKPRVTRTSSSYISEERKGSLQKRRQGESYCFRRQCSPSAEAKKPVTVTPIPNPQPTAAPKLEGNNVLRLYQ